jgi:hypothetical protein
MFVADWTQLLVGHPHVAADHRAERTLCRHRTGRVPGLVPGDVGVGRAAAFDVTTGTSEMGDSMYCEYDRTEATCEACAYDRAKAEGRPVAPSLYQETHTDEADDKPARSRRK